MGVSMNTFFAEKDSYQEFLVCGRTQAPPILAGEDIQRYKEFMATHKLSPQHDPLIIAQVMESIDNNSQACYIDFKGRTDIWEILKLAAPKNGSGSGSGSGNRNRRGRQHSSMYRGLYTRLYR